MLTLRCESSLQTRASSHVRARRRLSRQVSDLELWRRGHPPPGGQRAGREAARSALGGRPAEEEHRGLHAACASQGCVHLAWRRAGQLFSLLLGCWRMAALSECLAGIFLSAEASWPSVILGGRWICVLPNLARTAFESL